MGRSFISPPPRRANHGNDSESGPPAWREPHNPRQNCASVVAGFRSIYRRFQAEMTMARPALVTGFMPYGGRGVNPAAEIARAVEGKTIAGAPVVSRLLPVAFAEILATAEALLREINPAVVVSVGLWPGEPVIRIERVGLNVADFEIADNLGYVATDEPVLGNGA